jgi:hypothetical protein
MIAVWQFVLDHRELFYVGLVASITVLVEALQLWL